MPGGRRVVSAGVGGRRVVSVGVDGCGVVMTPPGGHHQCGAHQRCCTVGMTAGAFGAFVRALPGAFIGAIAIV